MLPFQNIFSDLVWTWTLQEFGYEKLSRWTGNKEGMVRGEMCCQREKKGQSLGYASIVNFYLSDLRYKIKNLKIT